MLFPKEIFEKSDVEEYHSKLQFPFALIKDSDQPVHSVLFLSDFSTTAKKSSKIKSSSRTVHEI